MASGPAEHDDGRCGICLAQEDAFYDITQRHDLRQYGLAMSRTARFPGEQIFNAVRDIKYVAQRGSGNSPILLIAFSAFPPADRPPRYYSVKVLRDVDCHKLFILDDHGPSEPFPRGCYYLGENRDFTVADAVEDLIHEILGTYGVQPQNAVTCGSSKGGTAALYFGARLGLGHVIAGEPQTKIGTFLYKYPVNHEVARYIAGDLSPESREFLDGILFDQFRASPVRPHVRLCAGKHGTHLERHLKPLMELMDELNVQYELTLSDGRVHSDLPKFFPEYLRTTVRAISASVA